MPHYGLLGRNRLEDVDDVRGAEVYGVNDEKLGKIDDVIFDHSTGDIRYAVVDTGGWLTSRKFLVPANRISPYGNHRDKFYAELDKERIQMLPKYDERQLKSETDWSDYEKAYREKWTDGRLMYNERTGRIVTPSTEETPGSQDTRPAIGSSDVVRDATPQHMGREDELLGVANAGDKVSLRPNKPSIGGRKDVELIQQERLRNSGSADRSMMESSRVPDVEGLREPGVYDAGDIPEAEQRSDMNEPLNANYGPRWQQFQNKLREGRDRVVSECPLCGTHKKVA